MIAANGTAHHRCRVELRRASGIGSGGGGSVWSCVSINDLTVRMAWVAGLALVALVLAGWRKTARAQPKAPRDPLAAPRRVPHQVDHVVTEPYHRSGAVRRLWSAGAGAGLALLVGVVLATVTAFTLAVLVTTATNLLKR